MFSATNDLKSTLSDNLKVSPVLGLIKLGISSYENVSVPLSHAPEVGYELTVKYPAPEWVNLS